MAFVIRAARHMISSRYLMFEAELLWCQMAENLALPGTNSVPTGDCP
jgi:hypothetical protein